MSLFQTSSYHITTVNMYVCNWILRLTYITDVMDEVMKATKTTSKSRPHQKGYRMQTQHSSCSQTLEADF